MRGVDIRDSGGPLLFRVALKDSDGAKITSGAATLRLFELQDDGTLLSYDFDDDTFKSGALTTATASLNHQQGDNGTYDTGVWTYALEDVSGFTAGRIYLAQVHHDDASAPEQEREFQFGADFGAVTIETVKIEPAADNATALRLLGKGSGHGVEALAGDNGGNGLRVAGSTPAGLLEDSAAIAVLGSSGAGPGGHGIYVSTANLGTWDHSATGIFVDAGRGIAIDGQDDVGILAEGKAGGIVVIGSEDAALYLATGAEHALKVESGGDYTTNLAVDVDRINGSPFAAEGLRAQGLAVTWGECVDDAGNTAAAFKTDLAETADDYYGDNDAGSVLVWLRDAENQTQARPVVAYDGTTKVITVSPAFDAEPAAGDEFILIGRGTT